MSGTVSLYHFGEIVTLRKYDCNAEKRKAVEYWKKIYGPGFKHCEIVDDPSPKPPQPPKSTQSHPKNKKYLTPQAKFTTRVKARGKWPQGPDDNNKR